MKQRKNILDQILTVADLNKESLPGLPLVEIIGDNRVLIENHCGVKAYGSEEIKVNTNKGDIIICGSCMELACMTKNQLVVTGHIGGVQLCRRGD